MTSRPKIFAATAALLVTAGLAGCVVPGDGYDGGDVGVSYGVDFYEPFDNNGEWGPGYLVGPPRGDRDRGHDDVGRSHAWHAEPGERHALPSLPHGRSAGGGPGGGSEHDAGHDGHH